MKKLLLLFIPLALVLAGCEMISQFKETATEVKTTIDTLMPLIEAVKALIQEWMSVIKQLIDSLKTAEPGGMPAEGWAGIIGAGVAAVGAGLAAWKTNSKVDTKVDELHARNALSDQRKAIVEAKVDNLKENQAWLETEVEKKKNT